MKETVQLCYTISEASKLMNVEPHVLRYWEDELGLQISRNSMGHRIYTDDDLKIFKSIQNLKASHISLKDIKSQLPIQPSQKSSLDDITFHENSDKMTQFKSILGNIIKEAMNENTQTMSNDISSRVSDDVRKEINYLIRQRDEDAEAHYKKLDETIRALQKTRQESAITSEKEKKRKSLTFFHSKGKKV